MNAPKTWRKAVDAYVTIVIPLYNERRRLERSFRHWKQCCIFEEFPVIFVDDGSTDGTADILKRLCMDVEGCRILYCEHKSKYAAIARAMEHVETDFVLCLDADTWYEGKGEELQNEFCTLRNSRADLTAFQIEPMSEHRTVVGAFQRIEYSYFTEVARRIFGIIGNVNGAAVFWRAEALRSVLIHHSLVFEGDDLEATIWAHKLKTKVALSHLVFQKTAKASWRDLIKQRMLIWDIGLFRVLFFGPGFRLKRSKEEIFFSWYGLFEAMLHPIKALSAAQMSLCLFSHDPLRPIGAALLMVFRISYIGAIVGAIALSIRYLQKGENALRTLFVLVMFAAYPALFIFFSIMGVWGIPVWYFWWMLTSIFLSFYIKDPRKRTLSLILSPLLPAYFGFFIIGVRTAAFAIWGWLSIRSVIATLRRRNDNQGHDQGQSSINE